MELKVKDIIKVIPTYQAIQFAIKDMGERIFPTYSEVNDYSDYYVTEIFSSERSIVIKIKREI